MSLSKDPTRKKASVLHGESSKRLATKASVSDHERFMKGVRSIQYNAAVIVAYVIASVSECKRRTSPCVTTSPLF